MHLLSALENPQTTKAVWHKSSLLQMWGVKRYHKTDGGRWQNRPLDELEADYREAFVKEVTRLRESFAFDEECRLNGTGGRKAAHLPKPKDTVPREQLALEKAVTNAVQEDGNKTRVQLENVEDMLFYCTRGVPYSEDSLLGHAEEIVAMMDDDAPVSSSSASVVD